MHDWLYPQIVDRDSTTCCFRCGKDPAPGKINEIHHFNGDDTDNRLENVCLLCHGCNNLKLLQKKNLPVSRRDYTPEHKKNLEKEPFFRKWLQGKVESNNFHYSYDYVIDEGAYIVDVSPETIKRYLSKICNHPSAPYVTESGHAGIMEVWLVGHQPSLNQ